MRLGNYVIGSLLALGSISLVAHADEKKAAAGKPLYDKYCAQCHGINGDAVAPSAEYFNPRPRDFTTGKYKVRSTLSGELPTDDDIFRAIDLGLAFKSSGAYTVMPPWPRFSDEQIWSLVHYLKTFSPKFTDPEYKITKVLEIGEPIASSEDSIKKGREVFEKNECKKCHGDYGRGDGPSAPTAETDDEHHIRPADLTKRFAMRGGGSKKDIYRTVSTGFNGTPMPGHDDVMTPEERWHLVNYIYSLSDRDEPNYNQASTPIVLNPIEGEIDLSDISKASELFKPYPSSIIPILGQVIEPGRALMPGVNEINVTAIYNDSDVALMVRWTDMAKEDSGENGLDLEVPLFAPAGAEEESDDPFADEEEAEEDDPFAEEEEGSAYSDAIAIQLPTEREEEKSFAKPYFVFGDAKRPVDIWFANLADSGAKVFRARGSESIAEESAQTLSSVASYEEGEWTVIFKRARTVDSGISFDKEGSFVPVAFSVWDGFSEERGNKRGLTSWFSLYQEPKERPSVIVPVMVNGFVLLLLELLVVFLVRSNHRRSA